MMLLLLGHLLFLLLLLGLYLDVGHHHLFLILRHLLLLLHVDGTGVLLAVESAPVHGLRGLKTLLLDEFLNKK